MADFGEVGSASVALRAKFDKLDRDLRRGRGDVNRAVGQIGNEAGKTFTTNFGRSLQAGLAGVLSVAAFRSLSRSVEKVISDFDEIAKTADSIGVTTDALQELRVAADLAGVTSGELDAGLRRFSRAAAEASQGVAEYKDAFDRLGVSVTDTQGRLKPIDQLVSEVADGFTSLDNATLKAATAQEIFGRGGVRLVNLLNEGSSGIENMRNQARELGIVIEEDLLRESERLNDELALLNRVIDAELSRALVNLAPLIVRITELLAALATAAGRAFQGLQELASLQIGATPLELLQQEAGQLSKQIDDIDAKLSTLGAQSPTETTLGIGDIETGGFENFIGASENFNQQVDALLQERAELAARQEEIQARLATIEGSGVTNVEFGAPTPAAEGGAAPGVGGGAASTRPIDDRAEAFRRLSEELDRAIQKETDEREVIQATIDKITESSQARDDHIEMIRLEQEVEALLLEARKAGLDVGSEEIRILREKAKLLQDVAAARREDANQLENQEEKIREAEQAEREFTDALRATGDQLIRAAFEGGNFLQILADLLLRLIEIQLQAALIGGGDRAGGDGLFGGVFGSIFGGIGDAIGGLFSGFGFADGGRPPLGQFSLVGEEGPELVGFGANARVFSNDELRAALTGGEGSSKTVSVTMNVQTPDAGSFRRSQSQVAAELGRMIRQGQARQT